MNPRKNSPRVSRKRRFGLIALVVLSWWGGPVAATDQEPSAKDSGRVLAHWLPLLEVVVEGEIQTQLLSPEDKRDLDGWLSAEPRGLSESPEDQPTPSPREECDVEIVTAAEGLEPNAAKALAEASTAFLGTIESLETGLFRGRLATLVTVEVERWLKWQGDDPAPDHIRFLDSSARARIGGRTYCRRDAERSEGLALGRRAFVATSNLLETEPLVLFPYANQLYFETATQEIWPRGLDLTWSRLEHRLLRQGSP